MDVAVVRTDHRSPPVGDGPITELANRYLAHLGTRSFSPATVRGYEFDLLNFSRFLRERGTALADVVPTDLFRLARLAVQQATKPSGKVVRPRTDEVRLQRR